MKYNFSFYILFSDNVSFIKATLVLSASEGCGNPNSTEYKQRIVCSYGCCGGNKTHRYTPCCGHSNDDGSPE